MYGRDIARKVLAKLTEEKSSILAENKSEKIKPRTLISKGFEGMEREVAGEELPSELREKAKRIERKRLSASGISREESHSLIERIGLRHREGR